MKTIQFFALFATLACASSSLSAATLQSLVTNEHKDGDVIVVPNGTYEPSNLINETRHLTFRAETDGGVIIDGGNTARCVDLSNAITLEGFVLQNGKADQGGGVRGGTIIRTTVQHCSATFGGGSYKTHARASIYKGNSAAFFGMAAYGGSVFSCRVEGNTSSAYGGGMGALFGVTVANTSVTGNTALRDNAGVLASPAQNMVYFGNVAERGLYEGAPMNSANALGSEVENAVSIAEKDIFNDAAAGDYSLNVNKATTLIKDKGDTSLGGNYDTLWYDTDLAGRPRMLGQSIDLGPYEIADTFTVTCKVVGVGSVIISPNVIQEGDPVTLTATADATYPRNFIGFYVNGELIATETTCTYKPVKSDAIEARFAGLSATTSTLTDVLTQLHPTIREEVTLANGNYTISGLAKAVAFVGTSIENTTITLSDDCKDSVFVNTKATGTASNATLHRCLVSNFSGSNLTLTSSVLASDCGAMSGSAVNVTAYTTMPAGLTTTDCVILNAATNTVAGTILPKQDVNIDAGQGSVLVPYDNLDIGGRPRVLGTKIDRGAHECHYVTVTVEAEGHYTDLTPAVGTYDVLTGDVMTLSGTSPRDFEGWTLADGTLVSAALNATMVVPEMNTTLKATFAGFTMNPGDTVPEGTTAADTITLVAGTYAQNFNTPAKIVGTGKQNEVILTGTITNASLEAVTLQGATLANVTLNRCYVNGGTITNGKVYNSILVNVSSATGEYVNNTTVNTTLPNGAVNTRALTETAEDYTPPQTDADNGESMTADQREALGDYDYYGNPRVNNSTIDKGAVEYVWEPYTVTINVVGHGLVSPRGAVKVVRGETLYFTVSEDSKHPRGAATVVNAELQSDGRYLVAPKADMTVTVTFPGLTVGADGQYADITAAIAEAQDGETITVAPGTYGAVDVKGKRLKLVAASSNPYDTIIDAQGLTRAVKLADGAEIIGFTIQNGLSNEGAGVYGGTVRRSVIRWNTLTYNGFGAGVSKVFAESCLIVDNGSTAVERSNGGGAANADLLNCTVVRNVADKGAGLYDCTAKNAVIALNVDLTGASSDWTGDSVEPDPSDCCTPTSGGIAVDATKLFVDAANDDWRLQEGVACVNAGAADERLSALDVTGAPRIYGEAVDMGALEWNAPDRKVKISLQGRGIATVSYTKENVTTAATVKWRTTETLSVPHGTDTLTLTWREDPTTTVNRSLAGVMADGVLIAGSTAAANGAFGWTLATRDSVNVDLVFVTEDLQVNTNDTLTAALDSAIAGETIRVASGEYTTAITVGAGITVDGGKEVTLAGGVTLADGAVLKNLTVTTTGVVGPETGPETVSATLQHCVVTEVNGTAVERNVIVKTCLIHNNAGSGLKDATAYLSTISANQGEGVTGASKLYGSIVWGNSTDVTSSVEVVDSYVGGNPRFILPAPDGENYALMSSSPAIDVAKMAQWEGFTDADRALTDLAGNPRPRLTGFDAGAYELQTDATMDTLWTWYGTDYTMDGTVSGAYWRQMAYGAPRSVPAGEDARITDRAGYTSATLKVDGDSSFGNVAFLNAKADLRIEDAGGTWTIASLANKSTASALTIDAKLYVGSAFYQNGGSLTLEPNADFTLGGHFSAVNIPVKQTGGAFTVASGNTDMMGSSTYRLSDGLFNFGTYLNLRDSSVMTVSGGELLGEEISIAQTGGTSLVISGGAVNVTRIETGDTAGGRWGDIVQTGGTVTITGSGSGKQAPLHISHWSGNSTYTLRGGELNVPNGEVRLGNDGNGTLRLEGGVAKLNTVSISNGKFQLAGGTVEAIVPEGTLTAEAVEGTVSTIIAYPKDATGVTLNLSGTGTVNLAKGSYRTTSAITSQNVMLGDGVYLYGSIDHSSSNQVLTVPGTIETMAPTIYSATYIPGRIAFSSLPPLNTKTKVLTVLCWGKQETLPIITSANLTDAWKNCCSLSVEYQTGTDEGKEILTSFTIYVTRTGDPESVEDVVSTTPTITVDGNTTWSDTTKWSLPFSNGNNAIVRAVSSGTLTMDGATIGIGTLTFDVPEGVTLEVVTALTAASYPNVTTVKKTGLGTLKWRSLINYTNFDEGEGSFIAAASGQGFGGKAFETMATRVEASVSFVDQTRLNVTVVEGVTLRLNTAAVLDGSITMEHTDWSGNGTIQALKAITFVGDFTTQQYAMTRLEGSLTLAGKTTLRYGNFYTDGNVRIGGNVTVVDLPGNGVFNYLSQGLKTFNVGSNDVTLGDKVQVLNNQWPDGAMKVGSGTLTFPKGYTLGGTATFSGPVVFSESLTTTGALHFKSDAVVTIPYGCTLTAADEIRVEPGARFMITNPPSDLQTDVTEDVQSLLVSTKTAGLRVDQLSSVAMVWATVPNAFGVTLSNPIPSLNGDTLQYTIAQSAVKSWQGTNSSDWSDAGNWIGTGDAVYFNGGLSTVVLSEPVEFPIMTIKSGSYTFKGDYPFEGKPDVAQNANTIVTWRTFFLRGSYMLHAGATAKLALNDWAYNGSFMGSGNVIVAEGRFALGAASNAFVGNMTVESGATLRLCNAAALYNASVTVKGTLAVETSTSVATVASDVGTLLMSKDAPLEVRQSLTGNTLSIQVTDITEVGEWTLLTYPATTSTTFELVDATRGAYLVAALKRTETALMLVVRSSEDIEWTGTKTVDGVTTDVWKVNGAAVDVMDPTQKNLFFNDVEGVATASVALPAEPRSLTVTAQTTRYTLSGTLTNAPITVANGAEVTLATTDAKPTSVSNEGVIIVTGTLDLTQASLAGFGRYVVGVGGVIRVGAQALAESTATFVRNGGQIIVVTEGDFSLPENRIPTENGTFVKEGDGTLYVAPTALTQPVKVHSGTLAPTGAMALKARYFKFEALERFNTSLGNNVATSLADFTMMLNGQKLVWPNSTEDAFVRFDSGSTHTILIGIENDEQKYVSATGKLTDLLDHNPSTELIWGEWHAFYCAGGAHQRNYFVIDAGEDGLLFTGYNVAVPSSLLSFFKKWTVAAANDISDWRPSVQASTVTENENQVWQSLDERTLTQPMEALTPRAWLTPNGYSARRASGFWSKFSAPITLNAGTTLDLTKTIGTSGILQDQVEMTSVTGEAATLIMPASLQVTADVITVDTLKLVGSTVLKKPITATTMTFNTLVVSDSVAEAFNRGSQVRYVVAEGYTGTTLPTLEGMTSPADGGSWSLKQSGTTLILELVGSQRELYATLTESKNVWEDLVWCDGLGTEVKNINWTKVQKVTLQLSDVSPDMVTLSLPSTLTFTSLTVDYGQMQDKALALEGEGTLAVETLILSGDNRSAFLPCSKTVMACDNLEIRLPKWDISVPFLEYIGGDDTYTPPALELGLWANGEETLRTKLLGSNAMALRSGTLVLTREEQFGTMTRTFRVDAGATLDVKGCPISNNIILNGGTLANTGNAIGTNKRQTYNISLTADSFVSGSSNFYSLANGYNAHTLTLNGYTLTKRGSNTFSLYNGNVDGGNGTIVCESGTFKVEPYNTQIRTLKNVAFIPKGGAITLAGAYTLEGMVKMDAGVVCSNNITLATNAILAGCPRIDGNLTLGAGAILEVTNAATPLEVRGTISSTVTMRLADALALGKTSLPILFLPNVAETSSVTVNLSNLPTGAKLEWVGKVLYLVPEGIDASVREVKATISGDANWSALTWTDMNGTSVTPDWRFVTAVTLTLSADATLTRDVATLALTSFTLADTAYTLTLEGAALPSTLTTLAANTSLIFGSGVLSTIPTNLSGAKNLTFKSSVTSTNNGGDTFAYNNFTGNWFVESGATLTMAGDGGKMGVMNTTGDNSGIITVKNGATIALNGGHVFGWGDTAAQRNRKVLVVDGGHVEVTASDSKNQYIRRTIELKNGATLNSPNSSTNTGHGINFTRDGTVLVTAGEATLTGYLGIGCDSANSNQQNEARFVVSENATLKIAGVMKDGTNASTGNSYPVHYSGSGTVILTGANTYTKNQTKVSESVTLLVNGSHTAGMAYTINEGASFGGTGTLMVASVTFVEGSKLVVVDKADPLTLQLGGSITFPEGGVMVTPPEGITVGNPAKLLKVNKPMTTANLTLTNSEDYALEVIQEGDWYTAICTKATLVTELRAIAGQSFSDIFDPATSVLAPNATLTIDFDNVADGGTVTPGTFTFDNATPISFASITVQGSNGGTLLKTGTGTVTSSAFTRDAACTDLTLDATLFTAFYTGAQTLEGWSLGLYVPADETATLSNVFTVKSGATLKKSGVGTLVLSSQNRFNDNATLQVLTGALHLNAAKESMSGDILVATGATLKLTRNEDLINFNATNVIDIYGTLDLDTTRWTLKGGNTLNLYPGAQVIGVGQFHDANNGYYGALDWAGTGAIHVKANNGVTGTVTLSANLRMRAGVTIEVEEGMTAIVSGTIHNGSAGQTLTKSGAGTLQYNCPVNPNSLSVTEGVLSGTGVIGGTLTFSEGTFLALNSDATQTLMVNGAISGTTQLRLATDVTQRIPVIASSQPIAEAFTLVTDYPRVVETVEGVTTLYVEPHPITELVATLSGDTVWNDIVWKISQDVSVDIGTTNTAQVAMITFNLAADARLTFAENMTTLFPALTKIKIASTLDNAATFTICGNTVTLPTVEAVSANAPITLCSAATSLAVSSLVSSVTTDYDLGLDVAFLNACTTVSLPTTYRLLGDGVVQKTLSGGVRIAQGKVTVGNELSSVTALSIEAGATLKVTTKEALTNFLTSGQFALGTTSLTGAGTLELAFENAETILEMTGNGGNFTGDVTVTSGTLKFPNGSGGSGPVYGRVITVSGANAALATGTNTDATGWNVTGRQKLVLKDGAEFKVYKRDTFETPLEMTGATIRLMVGARQGDNEGVRAFDWYRSPTLKVLADTTATVANPTLSRITVEATETPNVEDQTFWLRDGNLPVTVADNAMLQIDARLHSNGTHGIIKDGNGELRLTYAENTYTGVTTINAGTLTILGRTGTGATTMKSGTTLRGTGVIKGDLVLEEGAILEVMSASEPLEVRGAISSSVTMRLANTIAGTTIVPLLSMPNLAAETMVNVTLANQPNDTSLQWIDQVLYLVPNGENVDAMEVKATISGNANWSELAWTDKAGNTIQPIWALISAVTLETATDAVLTLDVQPAAVPTMQFDGDGVLTLVTTNTNQLRATETTVKENASVVISGQAATLGNVVLNDKAMLTIADTTTISTVSGTGTLVWTQAITSIPTTLKASLVAADWSGILEISTPCNGFNFGDYCSATSTIRVNGWSGWIAQSGANTTDSTVGTIHRANLEIAEGGMHVDNGNSGQLSIISGTLTGSGKIKVADAANTNDAATRLVFSGDANGFKGSVEVGPKGSSSKGASIIFGTVSAVSDYGFTLESGTTAVAINQSSSSRRIFVSPSARVQIAAQQTWSAADGMHVYGTLSGTGVIGGSLTCYSGSTLDVTNLEQLLKVDGLASGSAVVTLPEGTELPVNGERLPVLTVTNLNSTLTLTYGDDSIYGVYSEVNATGGLTYSIVQKPSYTTLSATVTTDSNWSELVWKDGETIVENPLWSAVTSVTLTAEADAMVTRDVITSALTTLTVADSEYTLAMAGKSLNGVALALTGDLLIADANTLTALPTLSGTGTLKLAKGVTVTVALTSESDNRLHQKKIDVATGATLVIDGNGANRKQEAVDYSGITGSGKIEFKDSKGNQWMSHPTKQYANTLTLVHNVDMPLSHEFVTTPLTVRDLQGGGNFRFDYGNKNSGARVVKTTQTQNTTWSGTYSATHEGRSLKLVVASDATIPSLVKMLTLSATNTNEQTLEVEASGAINVTGKWTGATTISGLLTGSGAINGAVTFNEGAVVVAEGQALTLGAVTSTATVIEVTAEAGASLVEADDTVTVFTSTGALTASQYTVASEYALEVQTLETGSALVVKRVKFITLTGTENFATETQQALRAIVMDALPDTETEGEYAVAVEVHTKGEVDRAPTAEEVEALLGCFVNVEAVEFKNNTATVKIDYEFGLADVRLDSNLNLIFTATVEGPTITADYATGVTFTIIDEASQESWEIDAANVAAPADAVGSVYLTLPDVYEVNGMQKSILTNFIGTRKFRVRVKR